MGSRGSTQLCGKFFWPARDSPVSRVVSLQRRWPCWFFPLTAKPTWVGGWNHALSPVCRCHLRLNRRLNRLHRRVPVFFLRHDDGFGTFLELGERGDGNRIVRGVDVDQERP